MVVTQNFVGTDFTIIWALAFKSKSISTRKLRDINVSGVCDKIEELIKTKSYLRRFGLYQVVTLLYGTTILYSKQTGIFLRDIEKVAASIRKEFHSFEIFDLETKKIEKKGKRKRVTLAESEKLIDDDEVPAKLQTNVADLCSITLHDVPSQNPFAWEQANPLAHEDLEPVDEGHMAELTRLFGGDVVPSSRVFSPQSSSQDRDKSFHPVYRDSADPLSEEHEIARDVIGNQSMTLEENLRQELEEQRRLSSSEEGFDGQQVEPEVPLFKLPTLDNRNLSTPVKRRRIERETKQLALATLQNNRDQYGDLIRPRDRLLISRTQDHGFLALDQLLAVTPFSMHSNKVHVVREIAALFPNRPEMAAEDRICVDNENQLDSSDLRVSICLASKNTSLDELQLDNLQFCATSLALESPQSTQNVSLSFQKTDESNVFNIPEIAEIDHTSNQYQDLIGSSFIDQFVSSERTNVQLSTIPSEKVDKIELSRDEIALKLFNSSDAPFATNFSSVFPPSFTDKKVAARAFYILLEMKKRLLIDVVQDSSFGEIKYTLTQSGSNSATVDLEDSLNVAFNEKL